MSDLGAQEAREMRARKGRPPSALTSRRSVPLRVWASHSERQAIAAKAERASLPVAEFMRRASLGKAVEVLAVPPVNVETRRELAAIGAHLNRIVRAMEGTGGAHVPADLLPLLTQLRDRAQDVALALATGQPVPLEVTSRGEGPS